MPYIVDNPLTDLVEATPAASSLLKKKAVNGVVAFGIRRVLIQLIQTSSNIILARILIPQDFGAYAIILLFVNMFTLITDIGFAGALVQTDQEPDTKQLQSVFTVQFLLGLLATGLMFSVAPIFNHYYKGLMGSKGLLIMELGSLSLLFYNLRLVSYALLERNLQFNKLVAGEVVELILREVLSVVLAIAGFGIVSLVWGLIISRLGGSVFYYILYPWKLKLRLALDDLRYLLKFGISFQITTAINNLNGAVAPIAVGGLAGTRALGLVSWAGGVGSVPRSASDILGKVIFPICSRAQNDKKLVTKTVERAIHFTNLVTFPMVTLIIVLAVPMTTILFTSKWIDGIPALYFFSLQAVLMSLSQVLTYALLALGQSRTIRNISIINTALLWLLAIPLVSLFGLTGIAIAGFLTSFTLLLFFKELQKFAPVKIAGLTIPYLIFSCVSGLATYIYIQEFPILSFFQLLLTAIFGFLIYAIMVAAFRLKVIMHDAKQIYNLLRRENEQPHA